MTTEDVPWGETVATVPPPTYVNPPVLELELAVFFDDDGCFSVAPVAELPPGDGIRAGIRASAFAEVCVPYTTSDVGALAYDLICFVVTRRNHEPTVAEALELSRRAADIVEDYGRYAWPRNGRG